MGKLIDLTGQKFNHLEVLRKDDSRHEDCACWICRCDVCGREVSMKANKLKSLRQQTCGCCHPMKDVQNQSRDRLYGIWIKMKHRCYTPKTKRYKNYGGRGITMCEEWLKDYNTFRDWALAHGYEETLTIDRINVNGNYEPDNCRWIPLNEQGKNTTRTVNITVCGISKCQSDWANDLGMPKFSHTETIINRIKKTFKNATIYVKKGSVEYDI